MQTFIFLLLASFSLETAFAHTVTPETNVTACEENLRAEALKIVVAPTSRVTMIPIKMGFIRHETIDRLVEDVRVHFLEQLGAEAQPKDWTLTLESVYPDSVVREDLVVPRLDGEISAEFDPAHFVARVYSTAHFSLLNKRRTAVTAVNSDGPKSMSIEAKFDRHTGALLRARTVAGDEAAKAVPPNVHLVGSVETQIINQTLEVIERLQGHPYYSEASAERASDHRQVRITRTYGTQNGSTTYAEVAVQALIESTSGGLNSHKFTLGFEIPPGKKVFLKACDDPDVPI